MTHQSSSLKNTRDQIKKLDESVVILQSILKNNSDLNKKIIIQEIIDAKTKLKRKIKSGSQPIKYGFLIALPLILLFIFMDTVVHGPQYFTTYKGVLSNLAIAILLSQMTSKIFQNINRAAQSKIEDSIDALEHRLYSNTQVNS